MTHYEKKYQELKARLTDEEIAEDYIIPADLTEEEKAASEQEIRAYRMERLAQQTEQERLNAIHARPRPQ